jgi:hypothetical protein
MRPPPPPAHALRLRRSKTFILPSQPIGAKMTRA